MTVSLNNLNNLHFSVIEDFLFIDAITNNGDVVTIHIGIEKAKEFTDTIKETIEEYERNIESKKAGSGSSNSGSNIRERGYGLDGC